MRRRSARASRWSWRRLRVFSSRITGSVPRQRDGGRLRAGGAAAARAPTRRRRARQGRRGIVGAGEVAVTRQRHGAVGRVGRARAATGRRRDLDREMVTRDVVAERGGTDEEEEGLHGG